MVYSKISILEAKAMSLSTDGVPEKVEKEANQSKSKTNLEPGTNLEATEVKN